ncbi:PH domain-containing protein [Cellulosilyticum ruminicola]|uniref:PH domain-containing protein n=1 Tax=Cellulosilyticum ruminicola TaxID=425254 RepID=UPI0006D27EAA|nr:PH domain-containing protein [Cellulosilyticum ruminicola]
MGLYDKLTGKASVGTDLKYVQEYFFDDEQVIASYQFIRDSIVLTNYGIYTVDVQGVTGKKVEVKFFPKKVVKTVSYETAGSFDLDVDIKIGVEGNTTIASSGAAYSAPISFKVPSSQASQAKEIIDLVKRHYLCS